MGHITKDRNMDITPLYNDIISKSIISNIRQKGFDVNEIDKIVTLSELEQCIFEHVNIYGGSSDERLRVFHLVQIWGGNSGRNIYVQGKGLNWEKVDKHYKTLVDVCLSIEGYSDTDFRKAFYAAVEFNKNVKNIGFSFITKHIRFWGYKNLKEWTFPPYDSVMSCNYMKQCYDYRDIVFFWKKIFAEAKEKKLNVSEYERKLFNQYQKDKKKKKKIL